MPAESPRHPRKKDGAKKAGVKTTTTPAQVKNPAIGIPMPIPPVVPAAPGTVVVPTRDEAASALGRAITIRRLELGFTRQALATRAGLSYPFVSEIERGSKVPSSASLTALAHALDLTPGALLGRAETLRAGDDTASAGEGHRRVPRGLAVSRRVDPPGVGSGTDTAAALAEVVRAIVRDELLRQPPARGRSQRPPSGVGGEHAGLTSSTDRGRSTDAATLTEAGVRVQVLAATQAMLGNEAMDYDSEGDLPIRRGEVMLFIRILDDPLSVLVFSPVLAGVAESVGLLERLNALNANMHFVRLCLTHGGIVVDLEVPAEVFVPALLESACRAVAEASEAVGTDLQRDFGGRLFFGEDEPSPGRRMTAGYL